MLVRYLFLDARFVFQHTWLHAILPTKAWRARAFAVIFLANGVLSTSKCWQETVKARKCQHISRQTRSPRERAVGYSLPWWAIRRSVVHQS
jgi:hypothetical protein